MKRIWIFMILIACPVMTLGQSSGVGPSGSPPYQPAVPAPSTTVTVAVVTAMAAARRPPRGPPCKACRRSSAPRGNTTWPPARRPST